MFIALIWKFDFAPFMVLIIAILNDGKDELSNKKYNFISSCACFLTNMNLLNDVPYSSRDNHDNLKGSSEAIPTARQLETERNLCNWGCAWRLHGPNDCYILLGHERY